MPHDALTQRDRITASPFQSLGALLLIVMTLPMIPACEGSGANGNVAAGNTVMDTVATISFRDIHVPVPSAAAPVAVNSDFSRVAVGLRDHGMMLLFDGEGEIIRTIGRAGQGPSEFREISVLSFAPTSDSLWVFDSGNGRVSVIGPHDDTPSRYITLRGRANGAAWASDSVIVFQGRFRDDLDQNALGRAVSGDSIFATLKTRGRRSSFESYIRPITEANEGGIWAGDFRKPEVQRFDHDIHLVTTHHFGAEFLKVEPENSEVWSSMMDTEPAILGLSQDPSGDLWMLFGLPADPLPEVENPGRAIAEGEVTVEDLSRTILTRYSPDQEFQGPLERFEEGPLRGNVLPHGFVYYWDADELGEATLTFVRLRRAQSLD